MNLKSFKFLFKILVYLLFTVLIFFNKGKPGNLFQHLRNVCSKKKGEKHRKIGLWIHNYDSINKSNQEKVDIELLNIVKFFLKSNLSLTVFESKEFRDIVKIKLNSKKSFQNEILPNVLDKVYSCINEKLNKAKVVSLIADIWSNSALQDFLAVAATITDENFNKECLVIGMIEMDCSHTAENIKSKVEIVMNRFDFDKSKIESITTDQGSNFLKLFKTLEDELLCELYFYIITFFLIFKKLFL